jgi:hypothetical protein
VARAGLGALAPDADLDKAATQFEYRFGWHGWNPKGVID